MAETPGGDPLPGYVFSQPVLLVLHYDASSVAARDDVELADGVDPRDAFMPTLELYDTASGRWRDVREFCPPEHRDVLIDYASRTATFKVCHLTQFGLFFQQRPVASIAYAGPHHVLVPPLASPAFVANIDASALPLVASTGASVHVITLDADELPGTVVVLDATASHDPDGHIVRSTWTLFPVLGHCTAPTLTESSANNLTLTMTDLSFCAYVVELTVEDNDGGTASAVALVRVNAHPTAVAVVVPSLILYPTTDAVLDGTASSDPDGGLLTYMWLVVTQPDRSAGVGTFVHSPFISQETEAVASFGIMDATGNYTMMLIVSDGEGGTHNTTVSYAFNLPPVPVFECVRKLP